MFPYEPPVWQHPTKMDIVMAERQAPAHGIKWNSLPEKTQFHLRVWWFEHLSLTLLIMELQQFTKMY
jgi:hypothetical protein